MSAVPRITVVTPSYNQAAYLPRTIDTVLSQAGEFELEYIVNDGGSSDASPEILAGSADRAREAGVSFHYQVRKDRGQSDAINQGLRRGTGEIVCWINSDDELPAGALATVARVFRERPDVDFINGDGEVIDEDSRLQWKWLSRDYDYKVLTSYHGWWNNFSNYILQQGTYWRRSVLERIGYLDESMHYAMDIEYWLRAGQRGMKWLHVPENLGRFRLIAGTKSLSSLTAFWPDYLEIFRRHRGVGSLHRFFAFYHYNLAHEHGMDLAASQAAARVVMEKRWGELPAGELAELHRQERQGFSRACALLASELYRNGHPARAEEVFAAAAPPPGAAGSSRYHLAYRARRAMGGTFTRAMDQRVKQMAKLYRSFRYDYRYLRG